MRKNVPKELNMMFPRMLNCGSIRFPVYLYITWFLASQRGDVRGARAVRSGAHLRGENLSLRRDVRRDSNWSERRDGECADERVGAPREVQGGKQGKAFEKYACTHVLFCRTINGVTKVAKVVHAAHSVYGLSSTRRDTRTVDYVAHQMNTATDRALHMHERATYIHSPPQYLYL